MCVPLKKEERHYTLQCQLAKMAAPVHRSPLRTCYTARPRDQTASIGEVTTLDYLAPITAVGTYIIQVESAIERYFARDFEQQDNRVRQGLSRIQPRIDLRRTCLVKSWLRNTQNLYNARRVMACAHSRAALGFTTKNDMLKPMLTAYVKRGIYSIVADIHRVPRLLNIIRPDTHIMIEAFIREECARVGRGESSDRIIEKTILQAPAYAWTGIDEFAAHFLQISWGRGAPLSFLSFVDLPREDVVFLICLLIVWPLMFDTVDMSAAAHSPLRNPHMLLSLLREEDYAIILGPPFSRIVENIYERSWKTFHMRVAHDMMREKALLGPAWEPFPAATTPATGLIYRMILGKFLPHADTRAFAFSTDAHLDNLSVTDFWHLVSIAFRNVVLRHDILKRMSAADVRAISGAIQTTRRKEEEVVDIVMLNSSAESCTKNAEPNSSDENFVVIGLDDEDDASLFPCSAEDQTFTVHNSDLCRDVIGESADCCA